MSEEIVITLTNDEALVLVDWLARSSDAGTPVVFEDQAEQRVLWDLESSLEAKVDAVLAPDYESLLNQARARVRDAI